MDEDNNEPRPEPPGDARPTLPPAWRLDLKLGADASGELGGVAELWDGQVMRCRLVLTRYGRDRAAAVARVNARVEYWLAEWLARPHSGDTGFSDLR